MYGESKPCALAMLLLSYSIMNKTCAAGLLLHVCYNPTEPTTLGQLPQEPQWIKALKMCNNISVPVQIL